MANHYLNQILSPHGEATTSMKDSGYPWIGEIPNHWSLKKLKTITSGGLLKDGDWIESPIIVDSGVRYLTTGNVGEGCFKEQGSSFISESTFEDLNCLPVYPGDLVVSRLNEPIGRACIVPEGEQKYVVAVDITVVRPKDANKRYLMYYMNSPGYASHMSLLARGTTMHRVSRSLLANVLIPIPSQSEQEAIVSYLDYRCDLINSQIDAVKQSIVELESYKQSIVTECVTKGLSSTVQYRDSGVSWIGPIPCSWDVRPVKSLFTINKRIAGTLGYDVLSITQKGIKVKDIESNEGQLSNDYSKYQIVEPGDFAMNHMDLLTGFVDLSKVLGVTSPDYRVFTPTSEDIVPEYALHIFQTAYRNKIFYGLGQGVSTLGRWRLPKEQFLNYMLPVPPVEEQRSIVSYLEKFISSVDGLIDANNEKLDALVRFKESLIFEYVTGKKQVPVEV